jgi:hypothetical protein
MQSALDVPSRSTLAMEAPNIPGEQTQKIIPVNYELMAPPGAAGSRKTYTTILFVGSSRP